MSCHHAPADSSLGLTLSWPRTLGSETPDTGHRAESDQTGSILIGPQLSHVTWSWSLIGQLLGSISCKQHFWAILHTFISGWCSVIIIICLSSNTRITVLIIETWTLETYHGHRTMLGDNIVLAETNLVKLLFSQTSTKHFITKTIILSLTGDLGIINKMKVSIRSKGAEQWWILLNSCFHLSCK